jgi:hypothetical protein
VFSNISQTDTWLSYGLAFVGGYGDAASFVLAKTFTGHVTGNLVLAAIAVAAHECKRRSNPPSQGAEPVVKCGYGLSDERSHGKTTDTGRDSADCGGVCN